MGIPQESIIDRIVSDCVVLVIDEGIETGGRYAWHYIGEDEARDIIRGAILTAIKRYQNATEA